MNRGQRDHRDPGAWNPGSQGCGEVGSMAGLATNIRVKCGTILWSVRVVSMASMVTVVVVHLPHAHASAANVQRLST